jgi:tellurite resistance protein
MCIEGTRNRMSQQRTIPLETALIYLMIMTSASDRSMRDEELGRIGQLVRTAPVFDGFNVEMLIPTARDCAAILDDDDGVRAVLGLATQAIPAGLRDTAYALACDVAAADARFSLAERSVLDMIRTSLDLDRLTAAAIERAAKARSKRAAN